MIAGLDGLRAVAFLIVFLFHTRNLPFGWMGVQLFFVLQQPFLRQRIRFNDFLWRQ